MKENREIEIYTEDKFQTNIVRPLVSIDEAVRMFNEYQKLKQKLRGEGDFIEFTDYKGNKKEAPTKQWRTKLTRFFGVSVEIIEERKEDLPDGSFIYYAKVRATAPNGLFVEADGSCWSKTKESTDRRGNLKDIYHLTRSHAITRAKNRAVLELVGFGEVSAEEISEVYEGKEDDHEISYRAKEDKPEVTIEDIKKEFTIPKKTVSRDAWTTFWNATRKLGYTTSAEVMAVLGTSSLKEWMESGRTLEEALQILEQHRKEENKE